ncbi:MAG: NAD(P)/FAD-dependent oxidoreductase [Thermoleophilaceae bacterium]|nr:NAD(P)/FAD-dependent oxidoreductase [Thermoleophilaceae bacterium]
MAWSVVIAGGGFGGFNAACRLERALPPNSARITLVNDVNFLLYSPLLPGAAGGSLEPRHVVVPLREELGQTDLRLGRVVGAAPERNCVSLRTHEGHDEELRYDHLIVALGSVARTLPVPGLAEHGVGFKTLSDAIALRNRLLNSLEAAETLESSQERAAYLTYVFVGGGYAGLEGLAELHDFCASIIDLYPRCRLEGTRWVLVEAKERVMLEVQPDLAEFATRELRSRGIEFRTETTVEEVTERSVRLSTGEQIPTRTLVWTAGVRPHPSVETLGLPLVRGRISVDRYMQVEGHENVWAVGDAAAVPDPAKKGQPCPPTAQHAIRQGRTVARNVAAALGSGRKRPFRYRTLGVFVDLGRHQAVASTLGIKWRGLPAWFLARTYHMAQMPGFKRKVRLAADWTVDSFFGRAAAELGQIGHPAGLEGHSVGGTGAPSASTDRAP